MCWLEIENFVQKRPERRHMKKKNSDVSYQNPNNHMPELEMIHKPNNMHAVP